MCDSLADIRFVAIGATGGCVNFSAKNANYEQYLHKLTYVAKFLRKMCNKWQNLHILHKGRLPKKCSKKCVFLLALVHFMVLGSRAPWSPNTINICWAPEISWVPIASKLLLGRNGSPTNFGSPGRPNVGGV